MNLELTVNPRSADPAVRYFLEARLLGLNDRVRLLQEQYGPLSNVSNAGFDSSVYLTSTVPPRVLKIYHELEKKVGISKAHEIVTRYCSDTSRALKITGRNPNPACDSVEINGKKYSLHFIVIPQGIPMRHKERFVYSVGQEYIQEQSVIENFYRYNEGKQDCFVSKRIFHELEDFLSHFSDHINNKLGTKFWLCVTNAKAELDEKNNRLVIYVTDLGNNLHDHYVHNSVLGPG